MQHIIVNPLHKEVTTTTTGSKPMMDAPPPPPMLSLYDGAPPSLVPLERGDAETRAIRRRDLLLDDAALVDLSFDSRRTDTARLALFYAAALVTGGVVGIVSMWPFCQRRAARATSRACTPADADVVIVNNSDGSFEICPVEGLAVRALETLDLSEASVRRTELGAPASLSPARRMIVYRHTRFLLREEHSGTKLVWSQLEADEAPPLAWPSGVGGGAGASKGGLSQSEASARLAVFGRNLIDVPIPPWPLLLLRECVHPFVIFQVWAVIVWMSEAYYSFSSFILLTALATAFANLADLLRNLKEIRRLSLFSAPVRVLRGVGTSAEEMMIDSSLLVPGDIVILSSPPFKVPADMVLLSGQATVTEAMLTGEATVVTKVPMSLPGVSTASSPIAVSPVGGGPSPRDAASIIGSAPFRCTLFAGTQVLELRAPSRGGRQVTAVVTRTGFYTVKGRLVLSILYPRVGEAFKFLSQSLRFVAILFILAMAGFCINAKALADFGASAGKIIQRGADMITIVVPPALPLAVTVGTLYALLALRRVGISCISPAKVNVAGKINAFVFDKTGTLTTEGLELACLKPVRGDSFLDEVEKSAVIDESERGLNHALRLVMACCHSLTLVAGTPAGDPLDVEVFASLGPRATLLEEDVMSGGADEGDDDVGAEALLLKRVVIGGGEANSSNTPPLLAAVILHVFGFAPQLARMGTLVRDETPGATTGHVWSLVKGSPEAISALCDPLTLPPNFASVLDSYARKGLRILGAGYKRYVGPIPHDSMPEVEVDVLRREAEEGLTFLGLIILENCLKPESAPTLTTLREDTGMPLIMATGDHAVAAVAIARSCGILQPHERVFLGDLAGSSPAPTPMPSAPAAALAATHMSALSSTKSNSVNLTLLSDAPIARAAEVVWRDVDAPPHGEAALLLDPTTLLPYDPAALAGAPYRLALTGRAFTALQDSVLSGALPARALQRIVLNAAVFARMSPEAKAGLVGELQGAGLYCGMIGDGANDAMALRAAHVGISLSAVEASVAAPFTSAAPNISAIIPVLTEGRGALATSFCLFQFMALYSTIQFANALLIVFSNSFLSNNQYLYQDLWVVFILSLTLGATPSATRLGRKRPSGRLFSSYNLTLTLAFIATTFALQIAAIAAVRAQAWYGTVGFPVSMPEGTDAEGTNTVIPETTAVFLVAAYQYVACGVIFSIGVPWKQWPTSNRAFCGWLVVVALSAVGITLLPSDSVWSTLSLQRPPYKWCVELLGLGLAAFLSYFVAVGAVVVAKRRGWLAPCDCRVPRKAHKTLRREWASQMRAAAAAAGVSGSDGGGMTFSLNIGGDWGGKSKVVATSS